MLISCVAYQNGEKLAEIEPHEIHRYVGMPDCFVWVALLDPEPQVHQLMEAEFDLHPLAADDARHGHQRPKIEEYGDSLFVVLQLIEPEDNSLRIGEVDIFVGRNYILSMRSGAEKGFQGVRARCERERELLRLGSGYVLYALMDAVVDRYFPILDAIECELERVEERIFADTSPRANVEELYALKGKLTTIKHAVTPLLEGINSLHGARVPTVCIGMTEYFRDVAEHLRRLNQSIDSIRDTIATAISVNLSMIALQENETVKRLASYGALVTVPTLIAGIYGMNFNFMPELQWKYGYVVAIAVMAAVDVYLFYLLRKSKWL